MRAFIASAVFAVSTVLSTATAHAQSAEELTKKAEAAYSAREYDSAGIAKALEAADIYEKLAAAATDSKVKAKYLGAQSEALYFAGNGSDAKELKIKYHLAGMQAGDKAVQAFGIADVTKVDPKLVESLKKSLSAEEKKILGVALYHRGINLGQWGNANGVMESLGRWPELRDNMQLVVDLGIRDIYEYGALRTLGRGYFIIPGLLGGSVKKAEKYLQLAVEKTKANGEVYSTNGYNNTFYAEILKEAGKEDEAKALLEAFLKADPQALNPAMVPETKRAQREAKDLLKNW